MSASCPSDCSESRTRCKKEKRLPRISNTDEAVFRNFIHQSSRLEDGQARHARQNEREGEGEGGEGETRATRRVGERAPEVTRGVLSPLDSFARRRSLPSPSPPSAVAARSRARARAQLVRKTVAQVAITRRRSALSDTSRVTSAVATR